MLFKNEKLTQKEIAKLLAWQKWEVKMRMMRRIHNEIKHKANALKTAHEQLGF